MKYFTAPPLLVWPGLKKGLGVLEKNVFVWQISLQLFQIAACEGRDAMHRWRSSSPSSFFLSCCTWLCEVGVSYWLKLSDAGVSLLQSDKHFPFWSTPRPFLILKKHTNVHTPHKKAMSVCIPPQQWRVSHPLKCGAIMAVDWAKAIRLLFFKHLSICFLIFLVYFVLHAMDLPFYITKAVYNLQYRPPQIYLLALTLS